MKKRVRACPYSATPHAHVGDCCEPGFEAGYTPPPGAYGPHREDQPTPVSRGRLDAVTRAQSRPWTPQEEAIYAMGYEAAGAQIAMADATVLLHQFSEWLDRPQNPLSDDLTHDDLVAQFLAERSEHAMPGLSASGEERP